MENISKVWAVAADATIEAVVEIDILGVVMDLMVDGYKNSMVRSRDSRRGVGDEHTSMKVGRVQSVGV